MENNSFQTSFIPKKPLVAGTEKPVPISRPMGIIAFLSVISVVLVVFLYGGLFLYKNILIKKLNNLHVSLKNSQNSFEPETISDLQLFDKRMSVSKQVISGHIVYSPFFDLLNQLTIPSIQFTKFDETGSLDGKLFNITMSGIARDYSSIAIQAQVFNSDKGKYFKDVVFSNLTLIEDKEKKGYIRFNIAFSVDPTLLSYEKHVLQSGENKVQPPMINTDLNINQNTLPTKPKTSETFQNISPVSKTSSSSTLQDVKTATPSKVSGAKQ
jgi:hypothetical protein